MLIKGHSPAFSPPVLRAKSSDTPTISDHRKPPVLMPTLSQSRNKGVIYFQFLAISKETKYYI